MAAIQAGESERMEELWEQVRRFVVMKARHVMTALEGRSDIELDDLIQSGYLALVEAVAGYTPESEYAFFTHLGYHLKSAFADATHFRTLRQQRETLAGTLSLDAPVNDEANTSTLGDFQEDPTGTAVLEAAEERIFQEQLREAVASVLADLPEAQRELLRLRFWEGRTLLALADAHGVAVEAIRQKEKRAIRELRKPKNIARLAPFCDFDYYGGTGLGAFRHTGTSIEERYVIRKEEIQERENRRQRLRMSQEHRAAFDEEMKQLEQRVKERVAQMTLEERQVLLEKYGYA